MPTYWVLDKNEFDSGNVETEQRSSLDENMGLYSSRNRGIYGGRLNSFRTIFCRVGISPLPPHLVCEKKM